jgi:hypothetical protein
MCGILHWLGTVRDTKEYKNPASESLNLVRVTSSSIGKSSTSISTVAAWDSYVEAVTKVGVPNPWFAIDLIENKVIPSAFSIRHSPSYDVNTNKFCAFFIISVLD